jgi:uncharacterized protein (DUF488 family)
MPLITFGHRTASAERMAELLRSASVTALADVRIAPGSRRRPHVARAELERWLPGHGISYRWEKRLGGFRQPAPDSPDVAWREATFRSGTSCTTASWRHTSARRECGFVRTACWSTT